MSVNFRSLRYRGAVPANSTRRARIVALLRQFEQPSAIATAEGCSPSLVYKIAAQEKIALRRPGRPSGATDDRAEALRHEALRFSVEDGMTPAQIAARLGCSVRSVQGYLRGLDAEEAAPSHGVPATLAEAEKAQRFARIEHLRWLLDVARDALRGDGGGHMAGEYEEDRAEWAAKSVNFVDRCWYSGKVKRSRRSGDALALMDALTWAKTPSDVLVQLRLRGDYVLAFHLSDKMDDLAIALEAWPNENPGATAGRDRESKWQCLSRLTGLKEVALERLWRAERGGPKNRS